MTGNFCRLLAAFSLILLTLIALTSPAFLRAQEQAADLVRGSAPPLATPLVPRLGPNLAPLRFVAPTLPIAPVWIPPPTSPLPSPIRPQRPVLQQLVRAAGIIFSGHVTSVGQLGVLAGAVPASTAVTFRVEHALRGVSQGQSLTIHEWAGLWNGGERYYVGERVLLFLYAPSKLGLTSPVAGARGRFAVDSQGLVVMNALHRAELAEEPILGGRSVVPYADFALSVRRSGRRSGRRFGREE
jgi:hypothetical protein